MNECSYPSLYQINTRVCLTELSRSLGRPATLDDIPEDQLDNWAGLGVDWIWLLSVWQTGAAGRFVSRTNPAWRRQFMQILPDLQEEDIQGSGFAITDYTVSEAIGNDTALARLRHRLQERGLRLMLDFVPNHTALDHVWVRDNSAVYLSGTLQDLSQSPSNYQYIRTAAGERLFAHGRDPYFPGWPDTLQLDYSNALTQQAMATELLRIARRCDGVRCDMAMLILPEVFERTWGRRPAPFWSSALLQVREQLPAFCFMAEVYWDLEWTMQQLGFDYAYDKRLYDRLRAGAARPVREHLMAGLDYQGRLARFLENHDEPRAAATFPADKHRAAAMITYLTPGLRFFQEGQFEGRTCWVSPHLVRRPLEPVNADLQVFYRRLLDTLRQPAVHKGQWQLLNCTQAWDGNWTHDCFITWVWHAKDEDPLFVAVNFSGNQSQCYTRIPVDRLAGRNVRLADTMSDAHYDRTGDALLGPGLYLDMPPWGYQALRIMAS